MRASVHTQQYSIWFLTLLLFHILNYTSLVVTFILWSYLSQYRSFCFSLIVSHYKTLNPLNKDENCIKDSQGCASSQFRLVPHWGISTYTEEERATSALHRNIASKCFRHAGGAACLCVCVEGWDDMWMSTSVFVDMNLHVCLCVLVDLQCVFAGLIPCISVQQRLTRESCMLTATCLHPFAFSSLPANSQFCSDCFTGCWSLLEIILTPANSLIYIKIFHQDKHASQITSKSYT